MLFLKQDLVGLCLVQLDLQATCQLKLRHLEQVLISLRGDVRAAQIVHLVCVATELSVELAELVGCDLACFRAARCERGRVSLGLCTSS